jgi:hypothetical protein
MPGSVTVVLREACDDRGEERAERRMVGMRLVAHQDVGGPRSGRPISQPREASGAR